MASIDPLIRPARLEDIPAITAIYAHAVMHGTGTFEIDPPDLATMAKRHAVIVGQGYSYLVAERGGTVRGYAYAFAYRDRPAYRSTIEDSVYVDPAAQGQGIGKALLDALVVASAARGFRQMIAVIGDAANVGSVRLHAQCGFRHIGALQAAGWKAGRWLDVILMQRALGDGNETAASIV